MVNLFRKSNLALERFARRFDCRRMAGAIVIVAVAVAGAFSVRAASADSLFEQGLAAAEGGQYAKAAGAFQAASAGRPASGTLMNLGLAEWRRGRVGPAVLAWERALWIDPFNREARNNLRFAGQAAEIESPDLTWYETASTWLPADGWIWLTGVSLWLAVGMGVLPGILRWRKAGWHQALAAVGLGFFLLSLAPHAGIVTRLQMGVVMEKATPLLLTPTQDAEVVSTLGAGESGRRIRTRGDYWFVRTRHGSGWVRREQFALVCTMH